MSVPIEKFGRDHWSLLGYLECRVVDDRGIIDVRHLRCDSERHPLHAHIKWTKDIPTRLKNGELLPSHDDWDCFDDLEEAEFIENIGTGMIPVVKMTDKGKAAANRIRNHKASGGSFSNFIYETL